MCDVVCVARTVVCERVCVCVYAGVLCVRAQAAPVLVVWVRVARCDFFYYYYVIFVYIYFVLLCAILCMLLARACCMRVCVCMQACCVRAREQAA